MTLDVTIGKIIINKDENNRAFISIKQCPNSKKHICDKQYTFVPTESYRSGSSGLWNFFKSYVGDLYFQWREHPDTNDLDIAFIKPVIKKIIKLKDPVESIEYDRMKWLKYWCQKAVKLYGKNAGIMFT